MTKARSSRARDGVAGPKAAARLRGVPREVYDLLAASERALKAYELIWLLANERGRPAQPPTVYRALKRLIDLGLAHRVESLNAYVACRKPPGAHEPVFFICDVCGSVAELDAADVDQTLRAALETQRFEANRISLDVHGACAQCRAPDDPS